MSPNLIFESPFSSILFLILMLVLWQWQLRTQLDFNSKKHSLLLRMVDGYSDKIIHNSDILHTNGSANFRFKGIDFTTFFSDPTDGNVSIPLPGIFAIQGKSAKLTAEEGPTFLVTRPQAFPDQIWHQQAQGLLALGFDEIEICAKHVEARRINIILTDKIGNELVSIFSPAVELIFEIHRIYHKLDETH